MDLGLKGKRAIVTGGTRGIGRAIVETLISEGVRVAFCARTADEVASAVKQLKLAGGDVLGEAVDIADGDAFKAWMGRATAQLGGLDILICNASGLAQGSSETAWETSFAIDMMGAQRAAGAAMEHLAAAAAETGDAAVVLVSSVSAAETTYAQAYGAIKAALIHYAKGLAREAAPKRVRVNAVSPGTILFEGGFWERMQRERPEVFSMAMRHNPTGRMGTPQEIADIVAFLVSPRSGFTTGANFVVDGSITSRVAL
jgi:3-oxoacyl-[acyl-carrier protein] reductase